MISVVPDNLVKPLTSEDYYSNVGMYLFILLNYASYMDLYVVLIIVCSNNCDIYMDPYKRHNSVV
jgi:hypothetical protein